MCGDNCLRTPSNDHSGRHDVVRIFFNMLVTFLLCAIMISISIDFMQILFPWAKGKCHRKKVQQVAQQEPLSYSPLLTSFNGNSEIS